MVGKRCMVCAPCSIISSIIHLAVTACILCYLHYHYHYGTESKHGCALLFLIG